MAAPVLCGTHRSLGLGVLLGPVVSSNLALAPDAGSYETGKRQALGSTPVSFPDRPELQHRLAALAKAEPLVIGTAAVSVSADYRGEVD